MPGFIVKKKRTEMNLMYSKWVWNKSIKKYNMCDLSTSNLKKQSKVKNKIKNEMKFHKEILECARKLEENIRVIDCSNVL